MRILMVCLGNICRSPIAEGVLRHKVKELGLDWVVESAGTESYHVGELPHRSSIKVCKEHGIDITEQRARKFTKADLANYDKIYALATDVYREMKTIGGHNADMTNVDIFLNELYPGEDRSVPDPYYGNEDGYIPVFKMIEATCNKIIEHYK